MLKRKNRVRSRSRNAKRSKSQPVYLLDRDGYHAPSPSYNLRYPVPVKQKRTLRYMSSAFTLEPGVAGVAADHVFSANGLYDPDITGVGHQPIGFDEMMNMYFHYTVIGAKITVTFYNTENSHNQFACIGNVASATAITNGQEAIENGLVTFEPLARSGVDGCMKTVTKTVSIGKFMGRHSILSEDDFRGDSSGNPAEQVYFHVFAFPNNGVDAQGVRADVVIDYITIFSEPKYLSQS